MRNRYVIHRNQGKVNIYFSQISSGRYWVISLNNGIECYLFRKMNVTEGFQGETVNRFVTTRYVSELLRTFGQNEVQKLKLHIYEREREREK